MKTGVRPKPSYLRRTEYRMQNTRKNTLSEYLKY